MLEGGGGPSTISRTKHYGGSFAAVELPSGPIGDVVPLRAPQRTGCWVSRGLETQRFAANPPGFVDAATQRPGGDDLAALAERLSRDHQITTPGAL